VLSVRDLADGVTTLTGDPAQPALGLVDLGTLASATATDVAEAARRQSGRTVVTIGVNGGPVDEGALALVDALDLTLACGGPAHTWVADAGDDLERITARVATAPRAAMVFTNLLVATTGTSVPDGLQLESAAYSTLLAGPEFAAWRAQHPAAAVPGCDAPVLVERDADVLTITLNRPQRHNAFGRAVRDGLLDALEIGARDSSVTAIRLRGAGGSFCSGGDLDEFGAAADPATAHLVRLARSAGAAVHALRDRITVEVHGACVGAGTEIPAFAGRIVAQPDAWFQLPEVSMGLIPGAGGTVSVTRRIGRWRTAYLGLTGQRIDATTAHGWGLVDELA
jgi:hypothetical protein